MFQSTESMWSVECLPKIKLLASKGGNYFGFVVLNIVRSFAWVKSKHTWNVDAVERSILDG